MTLSNSTIPCIVLTGGPCGGKTSTLSHLRTVLEAAGWRVFAIPEMATLLYSNGVRPQDAIGPKNIPFRLTIMRGQRSHEDVWRAMAALSPSLKKVVLQDRGLFDEFPYTANQAEFEAHLAALNLSVPLTRARYDLVLHLTSVAVDAPALYSQATNAQRQEDAAREAALADAQTWQAWSGHPNLHRLDNKNAEGLPIEFAQKITHATHIVIEYLKRLSGETRNG